MRAMEEEAAVGGLLESVIGRSARCPAQHVPHRRKMEPFSAPTSLLFGAVALRTAHRRSVTSLSSGATQLSSCRLCSAGSLATSARQYSRTRRVRSAFMAVSNSAVEP